MEFWLVEVWFIAFVKVARVLDGVLAGWIWVFSLRKSGWGLGWGFGWLMFGF
jgi:hypothetical protein